MLNELVIIERGARDAHIALQQRHPDVKDGRRLPTLLVDLASGGKLAGVKLVSDTVSPWTLRDGQHNSFPFVQPKVPLLLLDDEDRVRSELADRKHPDKRRQTLLRIVKTGKANLDAIAGWSGNSFLKRVSERRLQLDSLAGTVGDIVTEVMDRFVEACDSGRGAGPERLLGQIIEELKSSLMASPQDAWVDLGIALLVGKRNSTKGVYECAGALVFSAQDFSTSILDDRVASAVSKALLSKAPSAEDRRRGVCCLSGDGETDLITDSFPQPNIAILGQTYLFSKNRDIPANDRYGQFAADSLAVGRDMAVRLAAVFESLTNDEREHVTWSRIPSPVSQQSDLLLAFVHGAPDASAFTFVAGSSDDDLADEGRSVERFLAKSVRDYEIKTQAVVDALRARDEPNWARKVDLFVFRKIDPANRKVVSATATSISALDAAAKRWAAGEANVPQWLKLPVYSKKRRQLVWLPALHVDPLGLIDFSKAMYVRDGTQRQEVVGVPAAEALGFFLDEIPNANCSAARRVRRLLRMVLARRSDLLRGVAHARRRRVEVHKQFDCREALRTVSVLGIILSRLGKIPVSSQQKETDMESRAFQLGQLLAAVDTLHVGYCADVRAGSVPPTLLGNQVFAIAQKSPARAIEVLGQRLAPYLAWATRTVRDTDRVTRLADSKQRDESQRGWEIRKGLRSARELQSIARNLEQFLPESGSEDADLFHARLVLGYMSGIPSRDDANDDHS